MNVLNMLNAPWAIQPEILTEMCAIYAAHRNGESRDIKAIEAALGKPLNNTPKPYQVEDGVAVISIDGVLSKRMGLFQSISGGMSYTSLQQDLAQAASDPAVQSIILTIDSPGGIVDGCQGAVDAIYSARSAKPIAAYVDGKACSAAYWLGSAASQLFIGSDTDQVGSVGVIQTHVDTSVAEALRGIKMTDLTAGRYKAVGSQHAPLSNSDRNVMQDHLDHIYGVMIDTIARNRGVDAQTVASDMADGRVFIGQKAIDAGLVDGKMTLPQLMQKMKSTKTPPVKSSIAASMKDKNVDRNTSSRAEAMPAVGASLKPAPALTPAEECLMLLKPVKLEGLSLRRLLEDAIVAKGSAARALSRAQKNRASVKELESLVSASVRADENLRGLRARMRDNDAEQLAILHAFPASIHSQQADSKVANAKNEQVFNPSAAQAEQIRALVAKAKSEGKNLSYAQAFLQLNPKNL